MPLASTAGQGTVRLRHACDPSPRPAAHRRPTSRSARTPNATSRRSSSPIRTTRRSTRGSGSSARRAARSSGSQSEAADAERIAGERLRLTIAETETDDLPRPDDRASLRLGSRPGRARHVARARGPRARLGGPGAAARRALAHSRRAGSSGWSCSPSRTTSRCSGRPRRPASSARACSERTCAPGATVSTSPCCRSCLRV